MELKCYKNDKGNFLVVINDKKGAYAEPDGNFLRLVDNIKSEVGWASKSWKNFKEEVFPKESADALRKKINSFGFAI